MNTIDIKKKLIQQINLSSDKTLLKELYEYLNRENETQGIFELNEAQHHSIEKSRKEVKDGNYVTHQKANQESKILCTKKNPIEVKGSNLKFLINKFYL